MPIDTDVTIADYTTETIEGTGVFDVMMRAVKTHITAEYKAGRIKGAEYSAVYLGALTGVMDRSLEFLLTKDKVALELQMLQIQLEQLEIEKDKTAQELLLIIAQVKKVDAEVLLVEAQVAKSGKELLLMDGQILKMAEELKLVASQVAKTDSDIDLNTVNITLTEQKAANAIIEGTILEAQECKLRAEFDVLTQQILKTIAETGILEQKVITERAQTSGVNIGLDSVLGKQNALYDAQTSGFARKSEQEAAKIMVGAWNIQRTTNSDEPASASTNKLDGDSIGKAVTALLTGAGAV